MNKTEIIQKHGTKAFKEFEVWTRGKSVHIRINPLSKTSEIYYPEEYAENFFKK